MAYKSEDDVKCLCKLWDEAKSNRSNWENTWQEQRDLIRPNGSDFNRQNVAGDNRTNLIYDGTAPWANGIFAGGLQSALCNPTERWFALETEDDSLMSVDPVLLWLEQVSDIMYKAYATPASNFYTANHETFLDLGPFGTGATYQDWSYKEDTVNFRAFPLADCYVKENYEGIVDTLYRRIKWNKRQIIQKFGDKNLPEKITKCQSDSEKFEIVHMVMPREDRDPERLDKLNKRFASVWISPEFKHIFDEGGYDEMPYHVPRWIKISGEDYGRGPGWDLLPEIRMVNKIAETTIKAAQLAIAPPMMAPSDSFLKPIRTTPLAINYYDPVADRGLEKLPIDPSNAQLGMEYLDARQQIIARGFFADQILRQKKKERQTAYEIADERDEDLRVMAPMLGRIMSEHLGPEIKRTYNLLTRMGRFPEFPFQLNGKKLKVTYISPAAKAQKASRAINIGRFFQSIIPLGQIDSTVFDIIDSGAAAREMALSLDVTRKIIRPPEVVAAIRQDRQRQQQLQQAAEIGTQVAGAAKDVATAQQISQGGGA